MFRQMMLGIAHVHSMGIVHRDVKPENFLCKRDGTAVKLCDFGMAAMVPEIGLLHGTCGTPPYMSPEMVNKAIGHDTKTDVWSLGATLYVLIFDSYPYKPPKPGKDEMKQAIREGTRLPDYKGSKNVVSPLAKSFVATLLQRDTALRPCIEDALQSKFLEIVKEREGSSSHVLLPPKSSQCTPSESTDEGGSDSRATWSESNTSSSGHGLTDRTVIEKPRSTTRGSGSRKVSM
jgi:serine/threonine protein kinase